MHGSAVLGGFNIDRSDVDLLVVVRDALSKEARQIIIERVSEASLPCPATSLELAVVRFAPTQNPTAKPEVELLIQNQIVAPEYVRAVAALVLIFAVCRAYGQPLGPGLPAEQVFAALPTPLILTQMSAELRDATHGRGETAAYRVLNACRAWHYVETGDFISKIAGGGWALTRGTDHAAVIEAALAYQQHTGSGPSADADLEQAEILDAVVIEKINEALKQFPS